MAEEKDTIGRDEPLNEEAPTPQTAGDAADAAPAADAPARAGKFDRLTQDEGGVRKLTGMYKNWFLDYASYVILERAVPHVEDGLKPVQRRILHAMKVVDDGRYNKVANIVGQTMQYHPHGDASIKDALVQLGQKDLLIDCQGNWGNILTGDEAAAGRYIEARLSKFASEVVFNKKTTEWMLSYDGRKEEPVTLPIKFPLLLAQEPLTGLQDLIGSVPHTPADPQGAVVPEIAADLPHDHGHAIGGEAHVQIRVEVVDGLDEADAPHLEQVVRVLPPVGKALDHREDQPQVARDQFLPGLHVPLLGPEQEGLGLIVFQDLQL